MIAPTHIRPQSCKRVVDSSPSRAHHRAMPKISHAHRLVAQVAHEIAHEQFDKTMKDNDWYELFRKNNPGKTLKQLEALFVERTWGRMIEEARKHLAGMLGRNDVPEGQKEIIMEALTLDASLLYGRQNPSTVLGSIH